MEQKIGRKLRSDEVVHHINGDKTDNRIENLELISNSEHTSLHHKKTSYVTIKCDVCGVMYEVEERRYKQNIKHGRKNMCSKRCVGIYCKGSLPHKSKPNKEYEEKIKEGLEKGWTGYRISKEYGIDKGTVYNHIRRLKAPLV